MSLAVNARGDAVAAWARGPGCWRGSFAVEAAFRPARGSWRRAVRVGTGQRWCGRGAEGTPPVSVAVDPRGRAIVGWREANISSNRELIRTASRLASGRWQRPVILYRGGKFPLAEEAWPSGPPPQVVLDHSGNATAAWNGQVAFKPAGRAWGKPATIGSGSNGDVKLALDAKGDATALWTHTISMGQGVLVRSAFKPANGSWQRAVTLGQGLSGYGSAPELAVDARGNATAVWTDWVRVKRNACTNLAHAVFRPAGGGWGHPVTLQRYRGTVGFNGTLYCAGPVIDVRVAFGRPGSVTAVWSANTSDFTFAGPHYVVRAASKPAGGPWGRVATIAARPKYIDSLRLVGSPRGNVLAVWHLSDCRRSGRCAGGHGIASRRVAVADHPRNRNTARRGARRARECRRGLGPRPTRHKLSRPAVGNPGSDFHPLTRATAPRFSAQNHPLVARCGGNPAAQPQTARLIEHQRPRRDDQAAESLRDCSSREARLRRSAG